MNGMLTRTFVCQRCSVGHTMTVHAAGRDDPGVMSALQMLAKATGGQLDDDGKFWCHIHRPDRTRDSYKQAQFPGVAPW